MRLHDTGYIPSSKALEEPMIAADVGFKGTTRLILLTDTLGFNNYVFTTRLYKPDAQ